MSLRAVEKQVLERPFFERDTRIVARELLGKYLVHRLSKREIRAARIVETEAYHGFDDRASHASRGPTPRNRVMFGKAGYAYVYICYGIHHLLNFVTAGEDFPAAVLVRGADRGEGFTANAIGPGRLTRALGIHRDMHNGLDIAARGTTLWVEAREPLHEPIATSPRIGVDYAGECAKRPWRYYIPGSLEPKSKTKTQTAYRRSG